MQLSPTVRDDFSLVMRSSDKNEAISLLSSWPSGSCCESWRLRFLDFCTLSWRAALFMVLSFTVSRLPLKRGRESRVSTAVTLSSSANSTMAKTPLKRNKNWTFQSQNWQKESKGVKDHCYTTYLYKYNIP